MAENIRLSDIIPASAERIFRAFLDANEHAAMTGAGASDEGEGRFTAWDGYITGRTVATEPHKRLVQEWRTSEFPEDAKDSLLTVLFEAAKGGTKVTFVHTEIPDGQGANYEQGWQEYYFDPMKRYFGSPMEQVREVTERVAQAVEEVKEEALEAVESARGQARKQAVKAVKAVKKAQKQASKQLKTVGKKVKALVSAKKKPAKKPAPAKKKKAPAKKKAKPSGKRR